MTQNVAFYAGGQVFETWKDWSFDAATYWLRAQSQEPTVHPTLGGDIKQGAAFFDTDTLELKIYTGSAWARDIDSDKDPAGAWTFGQMPQVNNGSGPHEIVPSGGNAGQILAKVDGDNYNTQWQDPPSGTFDPAFGYNITGAWTFSNDTEFAADITLQNGDVLNCRDTGGTPQRIIAVDAVDELLMGSSALDTTMAYNARMRYAISGTTIVGSWTDRASGSLLINDRLGFERKVGFREDFYTEVSASRAVTQDDEGRIVRLTAGADLTLETLEGNTAFEVVCISGPSSLLTGTGMTVVWLDGSGSLKTGNRTLQTGAKVEVSYYNATTVYVEGIGIS